MKQILLSIAGASIFAYGMAQEFSQVYSASTEVKINANQLNSRWESSIEGDELIIPAANYNFANDYSHLQLFDSIAYTFDSWKYIADGTWVSGSGTPLEITIKGWAERGDIAIGETQGASCLNGYYNGIELKTKYVSSTCIKNLQFTLVAFGAAIQGQNTADKVDTYILTGNTNDLPNQMNEDLRSLIGNASDIRLDIRKMHDPKNFALSNLIDKSDPTERCIHIVGGPINNEYMGEYVSLMYEEDYEVLAPKSDPKPVDGEDFFVEEGYWAESITFTRTLTVSADSTKCMGSFILPFDVDAQYLKDIDAIPYTVTSVSTSSTKLAIISGTIPANTPFLVKRVANPKNQELTITVRDVFVPATPYNLQNGYLVGVYKEQYLPNGSKAVAAGAIKKIPYDDVVITAFRAFIMPTTDDYYATRNQTAITTIEEEESNDVIFNLLGQSSNGTTPGQIYVTKKQKKIIK